MTRSKPLMIMFAGMSNMTGCIARTPIIFNSESRSIQDAVNNNTEMVKKVREALIEIGLSESDLITTNFSLWSGYLYYMDENADPEAKKYTVNYSMQIVLRDASRLNEVLDMNLKIYVWSFSLKP